MNVELNALRARYGRMLVTLFWAHVPVIGLAAAWVGSMSPLTAMALAGGLAALYHLLWRLRRPRPVTRNIELEMIVNGWAWVVEQYAFDREAEYFEAQYDARRDRRGLWAMDNPEPPWTFKRRQKRRSKASEGQGRLI